MTADLYEVIWDGDDLIRPADWHEEPAPDPDRPVVLDDDGYEEQSC